MKYYSLRITLFMGILGSFLTHEGRSLEEPKREEEIEKGEGYSAFPPLTGSDPHPFIAYEKEEEMCTEPNPSLTEGEKQYVRGEFPSSFKPGPSGPYF